jgi:EmrB/QacA subfamily drug resistance transporter
VSTRAGVRPADDRLESGLSHRQVLVIFSGLMLGLLLASIDQTVVATALPTIVGDLGGLQHLSWVVTAYLLCETISTPIYGKLGDSFGRKRTFQVAIAIFLVGSVLGGVSQSMFQLIAFRAIQGLGAGGLIVTAQAIIADVVTPRERGRYQGYFGAVFGAAAVAGPLLGGFLTDTLSWRWVFYINVPLGIAALVVTSIVLPRSAQRRDVRIDWAGTALLSAAIACFVLLTSWGGVEVAWSSPVILVLGLIGVVAAAAFVLAERRAADPLLPLRLFRMRTFNISIAVSFLVGVALFSTITYLPTFLQVANGASASNSGLLLVPLMLGLFGSSIIAGQIITRTGRYRWFPIVGMGMTSVGVFLLSTLGVGSSRVLSTAFMVLVGTGIGLVMQILVLATQNETPAGDMGVATSAVSFFRAVGSSVGVAAFGALYTSRLTGRLSGFDVSSLTPEQIRALPSPDRLQVESAFSDSITEVFRYCVPALILGFALTWLLREHRLRSSASAPAGDSTGPDASPGASAAAGETADAALTAVTAEDEDEDASRGASMSFH